MARSNTIRRTSIAFAMLGCLLATPRVAHAGDDAAARAAAANDPEYRAGYTSPTHGAPLAGDCNDRPYAAREEFTRCQEQAVERTSGGAHASAHLRTAMGPRGE